MTIQKLLKERKKTSTVVVVIIIVVVVIFVLFLPALRIILLVFQSIYSVFVI